MLTCFCQIFSKETVCTAKNATDLLQVLNFFLHIATFKQVTTTNVLILSSLLKSGLLKLVICKLVASFGN